MNDRIAVKKSYFRWAAAGLVLLAVVFAGVRNASAGDTNHVLAPATCDIAGNGQACITSVGSFGMIEIYVNTVLQSSPIVSFPPTLCVMVSGLNPGDVLTFRVPATSQSVTTTCPGAPSEEEPVSTNGCTGDGRLNGNCGSPVAVYCSDDKIDFYAIDANGEGYLALSLSSAELNGLTPGSEPKLVKQVGSVRVYLLPDGIFKLMAPQSDGKTYYMFWSDCQVIAEGAGF